MSYEDFVKAYGENKVEKESKIKIKSLEIFKISKFEEPEKITGNWMETHKGGMIKYIIYFDKETSKAKLFLDFEFEKNKYDHSELFKMIPDDFNDDMKDAVIDGSLMSIMDKNVVLYESFDQSIGGKKTELEELSHELSSYLNRA